jgi:hypothetical protein
MTTRKKWTDGKVIITLENMPWVGKWKINPNILSNTQRMVDFIREHNLHMTFDCTHMGSGKQISSMIFYVLTQGAFVMFIFRLWSSSRAPASGHGIRHLPDS